MTPLITLTTDFGNADHYVGTMKGVLLSKCPGARLVDITHEIAPFSIYAGAYAIDQAAPYFPAGTVHLVVVDPGVGTQRKPILVEALGQLFVAPDNGVLSLLLAGHPSYLAREIAKHSLALAAPSNTFHGRDIFAPVAAALANQDVQPHDVGPLIAGVEVLPGLQPTETESGVWVGTVLSVDRFGNVITNFKPVEFKPTFSILTRQVEVAGFRQTFGSAENGVCFVYSGSSGYWELGMNRRSAAAFLQLSPGDSITLRDTIS